MGLLMKMNFKGSLGIETQSRVDACDIMLNDPMRLNALGKTKLMDSEKEVAFDRLANLAAKILKAPLTIISLVSDKKQFFKAAYGLPSPMDEIREIPIDGSICRYTLKGERIIANDASNDPLLKYHPATGPWNIGAFIAIPMITLDGYVLGAFCAVHSTVHEWTQDEIDIMEELTASVMTEIYLRQQVIELKVERELRDQFVMSLTHDLRTPLSAANLSAQILARKSNPDPAELLKFSTRISINIERADRMITDLLDASRIKVGEKISITPKPCSLNEIIDSTIEDLSTIHGSRFIIGASTKSINGIWDKTALQRSIENLANNAIKYGSTKKPVTISMEEADNFAHISVHNEGSHISESDIVTIFEPYQRTASASSGQQSGWGIGLALVKGLIEAHGGTVKVKSSHEYGTSFTIMIPKEVV